MFNWILHPVVQTDVRLTPIINQPDSDLTHKVHMDTRVCNPSAVEQTQCKCLSNHFNKDETSLEPHSVFSELITYFELH